MPGKANRLQKILEIIDRDPIEEALLLLLQ